MLNNKPSQYGETIGRIEREKHSSTLVVGNFTTILPVMDRITLNIGDFVNTRNHTDVKFIYK